jgi:hypothetical protein
MKYINGLKEPDPHGSIRNLEFQEKKRGKRERESGHSPSRRFLTDLELLLAPIDGFDDDGDDLQERGD